METISLQLKDRVCDVIVARGIFAEEAASRISGLVPAREKIAIVSDENVWREYGAQLLDGLRGGPLDGSLGGPPDGPIGGPMDGSHDGLHGGLLDGPMDGSHDGLHGGSIDGSIDGPGKEGDASCFSVVIRPGEDSKNLRTLGGIFDAFAQGGLGRGGLVVALGGGVVGDIAGFAAACWMRGVRCVQVPTSLLAMVDSSVGGKTAVDIEAGKNLVGAFHQPSLVIVDPDLLKTLPESEFSGGMAEVIKYGAIRSSDLFDNLSAAVCDASSPALESVITDCIRIKADIVALDEFDGGLRNILNFGHTFGHAIEAKYGYSRYSHGMAVAAGMRIAARYGEAAGFTARGTADRLEAILGAYGLDLAEPADDLAAYMKRDKKAAGDTARLILLKEIGAAEIVEATFAEVEERLAGLRL